MPSANNVHREFDYSWLSRNVHRKTWRVLAFIVFGSIAGASGLVVEMLGQEPEPTGRSLVAAGPVIRSAAPSTIVSPAALAASAPDSRQDSASPSNSAQAAPVDAIATVATEPPATAAPAPPPSVAAPKKPQKVAAKKPKKPARQNRGQRDWYDAYAWRAQNGDYWRGRSYYQHQGRFGW